MWEAGLSTGDGMGSVVDDEALAAFEPRAWALSASAPWSLVTVGDLAGVVFHLASSGAEEGDPPN